MLVRDCSFDSLSRNAGYPLSFGVPYLGTAAAAALGNFAPPHPPPLSARFGSDYFASNTPPGISPSYPGISHPALVSSYPPNPLVKDDPGAAVPLCCLPEGSRYVEIRSSWRGALLRLAYGVWARVVVPGVSGIIR